MEAKGGSTGSRQRKMGGFSRVRGAQAAYVCVVGVSQKFPLSPPLPPHVHKCVPAAIVTLSYSRTEGLTNRV